MQQWLRTCVKALTLISLLAPSQVNGEPINAHNKRTTVNLRIEGLTTTIFEGPISSTPCNITTASGGTHHCDGTNNNQNPSPGATLTTALDAAAHLKSFPYDGTYSSTFDDFFITSIGPNTQTSTQFWGVLINYQFSAVGGCQQITQKGDDVLWAFDAFNALGFLQVAFDEGFEDTKAVGRVGVRKYVYVRDGPSGNRVPGASIGGVVTDSNGRATLRFWHAGTYNLKATKAGWIRSNAVKLVVRK